MSYDDDEDENDNERSKAAKPDERKVQEDP